MASPFVHVEISSRDLDRAKEFYARVFGWGYQEMMPNYATILCGLRPGDYGCAGGLMTVPEGADGPAVMAYIQVDDVDAALARVVAAGGRVARDQLEVPGYGWFGTFQDLDGNLVCVWKPMAPPASVAEPPATAREAKPRSGRKASVKAKVQPPRAPKSRPKTPKAKPKSAPKRGGKRRSRR